MIYCDSQGYYTCSVCDETEKMRILTTDRETEEDLRFRFWAKHRDCEERARRGN